MRRHSLRAAAWLTGALIALGPTVARAQDALAKAKDYYASAAYEEALSTLQSAHDLPSSSELTEVAAYQMFCLLALGRGDEAKQATEMLVRIDPLYHPSEAQASPRVRTFFENARRPLLPEIVRQSYTQGRDAFDKKDLTGAQKYFDLTIALIDEIGVAQDQALGDLRTVVSGFRDLTKLAVRRETASESTGSPASNNAKDPSPAARDTTPATPASTTTAPVPAAPPAPSIYGPDNADVVRPVPISRAMPTWQPSNPMEQKLEFKGYLDLVIDESGRVTAATLIKSIHPRYDSVLLQSVKNWKFRPATKDGQPVKYMYRMSIELGKK